MSDYSYRLAPYQGPRSRQTCPSCQKPRQFVRYVHVQTGTPLGEQVGRCNREVKCGYHYTPQQYLTEHQVKSPNVLHHPTPLRRPEPPRYIDHRLFKQSLRSYDKNHLVQYLKRLLGPEKTQILINKFHIGTSKRWRGATIFWQMDLQGRLRTGKIMLYDPESGKRVKKPYNHIDWVHKKLKQPHFSQCLFGLHQLRDLPNHQPVGLVESEKTAIIATGYFPAWIWLGVGSLHQLSPERCAVLKGRKVVLFPDAGGWGKWKDKAKALQKTLGGPVLVSDWLEKLASQKAGIEGVDLADVLVAKRLKSDNNGLQESL